MRKLFVAFLAVGMLFVAGCGNEEKVIQGNVQNVVTGEEQPGDAGEEQQGRQEKNENGAPKGYVFTYNGTVVEMDAKAESVVEKLGEPASYFEAASCAFEGLDKVYTYSGFELDTYPVGDADHISAVILKDDSVATTEGVSIGDSLEKLEQAYGTDSSSEGGMLVYGKDGMKLCFILQDDEIISIEYRSTVLEE